MGRTITLDAYVSFGKCDGGETQIDITFSEKHYAKLCAYCRRVLKEKGENAHIEEGDLWDNVPDVMSTMRNKLARQVREELREWGDDIDVDDYPMGFRLPDDFIDEVLG